MCPSLRRSLQTSALVDLYAVGSVEDNAALRTIAWAIHLASTGVLGRADVHVWRQSRAAASLG
jgi:hypothetical protein